MKAQTTIEFMAVLLILTAYMAVVFSLFSSAKGSLEQAADRKLCGTVERWMKFIAQRPEGTEIKLDLAPYRGRHLKVECGDRTKLSYPSGSTTIGIPSTCNIMNITKKTCISMESTGAGVRIEVC